MRLFKRKQNKLSLKKRKEKRDEHWAKMREEEWPAIWRERLEQEMMEIIDKGWITEAMMDKLTTYHRERWGQ